MPLLYRTLDAVRHQIADGDPLLFRRRGLISIAGRGVHAHAAMAAWWDTELFCLEIRELFGGRAVTLASQVERYPGRIDVYRANPTGRWRNYDGPGAMRYMRGLAGCDYGYRNLAAASLLHLPWVRLCVKPSTDDAAANGKPPFCSEAVARAHRIGGGVDPVPNLADRITEPADLARSAFYRYQFTLMPRKAK